MIALVDGVVITTAAAGTLSATQTIGLDAPGPRSLLLQGKLAYGSGGTSIKAWVQSSVDGGATWFDIACFAFTTASKTRLANLSSRTPVTTLATPTDGSMADDTVADGLIGDRLRVKYTSVGTYAGDTTLTISAIYR